MPVEIERKFRVTGEGWRLSADAGRRFRQGYVAHGDQGSVRVRLAGDRAWLTLKSVRLGLMRHEFEYEIPLADAEEMLTQLCAGPVIEKTRYRVPHAGKIWEVDIFDGPAAGLVLAEVEMRHAGEWIDLPGWVGEEVTDDPRFRNSAIALVLAEDRAHEIRVLLNA